MFELKIEQNFFSQHSQPNFENNKCLVCVALFMFIRLNLFYFCLFVCFAFCFVLFCLSRFVEYIKKILYSSSLLSLHSESYCPEKKCLEPSSLLHHDSLPKTKNFFFVLLLSRLVCNL